MGGPTRSKRFSALLLLCAVAAVAVLVFAVVAREQEEAEAAYPGGSGKIAFIRLSNGDIDIYSMNDDGSGVTQLTSAFDFNFFPVWSADGTKIAFLHLLLSPNSSDIYTMNADGSGLTNITNGTAVSPGDLTWSPDGTKIAFANSSEIYVINADGTGLTNLTNSAGDDDSPAWSPDGLTIAYDNGNDIYVMNANGTGITNPTNGNGGESPNWQPLPDFPNSNVDLIIKQMKVELETAGFCGFTSTTLGVRITISNTGSADAGSFVVEVNGAQQTVSGGLAAASNTSLWFAGYVQFDPNVAEVDVLQQVEETNESNNTSSPQLPVPTLPPTCTPMPTLTPTPTPTPKQPDGDGDGDTIPNSIDLDDDNDGCTDVQENGSDEFLGGLRNPHNPWDFYDVLGPGAALPLDKLIDLPNDILGVILRFSPQGQPPYDVTFDRGVSSGPNVWKMTAPDGVIDLPNDILGVILQFDHSCQ